MHPTVHEILIEKIENSCIVDLIKLAGVMMWIFIRAFPSAFFICACSAMPSGEIENQYIEATRRIGVNPVYPPREDIQVGDVFLVARSTKDRNMTQSIWMKFLPSIQREALEYTNNVRTPYAGAGSNSLVDALPIVSFPSLQGSAASAVAFGGLLPSSGSGSGFGFGAGENVLINFKDTRAFGPPRGALRIGQEYEAEFHSEDFCPVFGAAQREMTNQILEDGKMQFAEGMACKEGSGVDCEIHIITRTYLTKKIEFVYRNIRTAQGGRNVAPNETTTASLPNVNISVNVDAATPAESVSKIMANIPGAGANITSPGALASYSRGSAMVFSTDHPRYITIAYESINRGMKDIARLCP